MGDVAVPLRRARVHRAPARRRAAVAGQHAVRAAGRRRHSDRRLRPVEPRAHEDRVSPRPRPPLRPRDASHRGRAFQLFLAAAVLARVPARSRQRRSRSTEFRSAELMGLVRNYRRCAWLVTYLNGASPALCRSFRPEGHELLTELDSATWYAPYATSLRMSDLGYRNKTQGRLSIRANSLAEYLAGIRSAVTTLEPRYAAIGVVVDGEYRQLNANILQIENEYYSTIRPKPGKASKVAAARRARRRRRRLRRGAHARLERRRPRRHEPKRAAVHRGAADLLFAGREPADLGSGAGRDRCARSHGRA